MGARWYQPAAAGRPRWLGGRVAALAGRVVRGLPGLSDSAASAAPAGRVGRGRPAATGAALFTAPAARVGRGRPGPKGSAVAADLVGRDRYMFIASASRCRRGFLWLRKASRGDRTAGVDLFAQT